MAHHTLFCLAVDYDEHTLEAQAVAGPAPGQLDVVTVPAGKTVGVIASVSDYMGIRFHNLTPAPGDTIAVTGATGAIPDYQTGMFFSVNDDGIAYLTNAGHFDAIL